MTRRTPSERRAYLEGLGSGARMAYRDIEKASARFPLVSGRGGEPAIALTHAAEDTALSIQFARSVDEALTAGEGA